MTCPADCGPVCDCGDGTCNFSCGENPFTCPEDCGPVHPLRIPPPSPTAFPIPTSIPTSVPTSTTMTTATAAPATTVSRISIRPGGPAR